MRHGLARTGSALAIGLSALWMIAAAGFIVFGVLLLVSGDDTDTEGFLDFFGGGLAGVGVLVLAGAVGGIVLGLRLRRGRGGRVGVAALFTTFALVSGSFLAASLADETGVDAGGVVGFGLNTAICLTVVAAALFGRPD